MQRNNFHVFPISQFPKAILLFSVVNKVLYVIYMVIIIYIIWKLSCKLTPLPFTTLINTILVFLIDKFSIILLNLFKLKNGHWRCWLAFNYFLVWLITHRCLQGFSTPVLSGREEILLCMSLKDESLRRAYKRRAVRGLGHQKDKTYTEKSLTRRAQVFFFFLHLGETKNSFHHMWVVTLKLAV